MQPTFDNVYVTQWKEDLTRASGIILSSSADSGVAPAKILALGPDVVGFDVGDKVYLKWGDSVPITNEGTIGALIPHTKILAILKKAK
jgi:co-chaperonin GroES (HSP10)